MDFQNLDSTAFTPLPSVKSHGWSAFDKSLPTLVDKSPLQVTHVDIVSELMAVTCGPRVDLYRISSASREEGVRKLRSITRFKGLAKCARLRHDCRLLIAGSESGVVRVFDCDTKSAMRTFGGHEASVEVCRWSPDGSLVLSGSNDATCRLFDLQEVRAGARRPPLTLPPWRRRQEKSLAVFRGHSDHVRALCFLADDAAGRFASGAYDHSVKLWGGAREPAAASLDTLSHGSPVEAVLALDPVTLLSAGSNVLLVWDLRHTREPLQRASHHQKTITQILPSGARCLARRSSPPDARRGGAGNGDFVLTASLDGSVKVCGAADLTQAVHALKFKGPVLSLALTPDDWRIAAGTSQGELVVRGGLLPALIAEG
jgi:U3 small nucleolar RNA-associated protein 15